LKSKDWGLDASKITEWFGSLNITDDIVGDFNGGWQVERER
jgi:hypothetical protein